MTTGDTLSQPRAVAIVGLGHVGRAVGQALVQVRTNYRVRGHDRDADRVKAAMQAGAVDDGHWNLAETVANADMVVLSEPLEELLDTLRAIAPHLLPGSLVTDTAGIKVPVLRAAAEFLPAGVSFVGGHPVLRPSLAEAASPLAGATYCLVPLPSASEAAVRAMTRWVEAAGAEPYFIDAAEHDALVAGVEGLPGLVASTLLALVERSPSARDLWRLAGPAMGQIALAPAELDVQLRAELLQNREAVLAWLDQVQMALAAARQAVVEGEGGVLDELFATAQSGRQHWASPPLAAEHTTAIHAELKDYNPIRDLFSFGRRKRPES